MITGTKKSLMLMMMGIMSLVLLGKTSPAAEDRSPFQAAGDDSRVILRWIWPQNSLTAPDYNLYRQEKGQSQWQLLTPQPISKIDSKEKAKKILGKEMFKKYETILFPVIPDPDKDLAGFRKVVQHMGEIWGMTMLVADMYPEIADLLGVRYMDHDVKNGKTYIYRLAKIKGNQETDLGITLPVTPNKVKIPPVLGFSGEAGDSVVFHKWQVEPRFTAYDLYRSHKRDGRYQKVNTAPIVILSRRDDEGNTRYPEWFYTDRDLKNGETYWYSVQGRDSFGRMSGFTEPLFLTPSDSTPPKPLLEFTTKVERDTVTLSWKKGEDSDLAGYNIYRSLDYKTGFTKINKKLLNPDTVTYVDNNLPLGKNWWYFATAVDKEGNESPRSYTALANVRDYIPPRPPEGLDGKTEPGKVLLSWQPNGEVDLKGYRIYQSMKKDADYYHLLFREPVQGTSYTNLLPETASANPYFYKITAVDRSGNESRHSKIIKVQLPDVTPPYPPVFKKAEITEGMITLIWHSNIDHDLAGYNLYRKQKGQSEDSISKLNLKMLGKETISFVDNNLVAGTRFIYTLEAADKAGNVSRPSDPITAATFDQSPPERPKALKARPVKGKAAVLLSWSLPEDNNLKGVILFRAKKKEGPYYPITEFLKTTSFLDNKIRYEKPYYYRLAAFDSSSNKSEYSNIAEVLLKKKKKK